MSISSFKKCLLTLLISTPFGTSLLVRAQTPPTQYATIGFERNTGVLYFPVYRLNANSTERFNRGATTYTETELQQAGIFPGHRITKIAFEKESGGTLGSNPLVLKVWMQTIPTSGPSGLTNIFDQDILSANQVFLDSNTIILDSASWFEIDLDTAFIYSGGNLRIYTENIILGASPFSTGPISWYFSGNWNVSSGRNNISYPFPSGQVLSGSNTIGYRPNTRIGFESPIGSDISLKQFLSPTSICAGFTDVEVEIQNTGITDLDSIMISWQVNSVFQSQISYQPVLPSGGTVSISLGNFIANHDSIYEITAFLANADSIGDAFSANDTIRITYQPALFGGYTINSAVPTGGNNFQSFNEASAALSQRGVCGPVAMIVALNSGPYNERVIFGEIFGVDSINRITIIGNNNALIHNSFNPAMELNGADYLTIINLTIIMNGLNSAAVYLSNRSDYNTFENCSISFSGTATNSASVLLGGGILPGIGGQAGDYNSFKNCVIDGGGFAAALYGANTNNRSIGNSFINCEIKNFVGTGIHISNQEDFQIKNCKIHRTGAPPLDNVRGITLDGDIRGTTIEKSEVYDLLSGGGPSITYGIYCIGSGSLDKPILIKNNLLYNFNSNGLIQAISVRQNANHLNLHHNTVVVDNMNHTGNSMVVGIFCDNLITHFQVLNNIIFVQSSSTGQKTLLRITANAPNIISNGNAFHLGVTGIVGQSGSGMFNTLAGWQTSTNRDLNSVQADPLFVSLTLKNFTPSSPLVNDIGDSIGIAEDFFSNLRDLSAPDPGAIEFSPFSRDLRLSNVVLHPDPCLLGNDTIFVEIENIIGPTIPLNTEPITVHWLIQGPNTSTGSVVFNSGNLPINTKTNKISTTINLSTPGTYEIIVFLDTNQVNQNPYNDTILLSSFVVEPIFWIEPKSDSLFDDTTTVRLQAFSPNFAVGKVIITEITQNRVGSSAPITGWPSYIKANQYVELFGPANEDISGYTLEQWSTQSLVSTYTFPPGTILSPQGTAIIGTGLFGSSVESPSDFYYHGALPTFPHFGGTISSGRILKNAEGVVVDALGYSTVLQQPYTFPNSAELPYYHWNPFGNNFIHNGKMLLGPDKNSHENWAPLSWAPFRPTPNIPNSNVPQPDSALSFPVTWTVNGAFAGSGDVFHAGPFPTPGTYEVIATYPSTNGCGLLSDTAIIIVDFPYCYALDSFQVQTGCEEISLAWTSDNTQKRSFIEYGLAGFTRGSGTLIPGAQSPHTISNLSGNTFYDIYVIDSCFQFDPSINDTVFFDQTIVFDTSIFVTPYPVAGSIHYAHDGMGGYNFWLVGSAGPIEWYFGDGTFANGDSVSHKFMQNGVYNIVVIAENNCGSDTVKLDFKHIGTEVFQAQYLVLYPNPGNGNFRIENAPFKESFQIQMIDGTGNSWILGNFEPKSDFELSITSLPAGIYQMIFTNREGFVIRRVVKL